MGPGAPITTVAARAVNLSGCRRLLGSDAGIPRAARGGEGGQWVWPWGRAMSYFDMSQCACTPTFPRSEALVVTGLWLLLYSCAFQTFEDNVKH